MLPVNKKNIVEPLPRQQRQRLFLLLLLIFVCAVPVFVFYATGYRYNLFDGENGITTTGGMYIAISQNNGEIYLNDEPARGSRIFRRATYIQSVTPGLHRVHVQGEGLQTWVKDLPVFSHMVTEAEAFLLPIEPVARLITASSTASKVSLVTEAESALLDDVSSVTNLQSEYILFTEIVRTTQILDNPEFAVLSNLFNPNETEPVATSSVLQLPATPFRFADEIIATTTATTSEIVRIRGDMKLFLREGELFAQYIGGARSIPNYFCVPTTALASTTELFGAQVAYGIDKVRVIQSTIQPIVSATLPGETRICRNEIRLDTKFQTVIDFDFLPGSSDHVLVQRDDGVYVVEIDDRAWQNVQTLLPLPVEAMLVDNNRIFIQTGELFVEIETALPSN